MSAISITITGRSQEVAAGTTGTDLFGDNRAVVAMRVNGHLQDLFRELPADAIVDPVLINEPDGLDILRHSAAHVLAQAVQLLNPEARLGIGPPIEDGFYYDFDVDEAFTPADLKALQKQMQRIINEGQTFSRRVVSEQEARTELAHEPYKCELIGLKEAASTTVDGAEAEVGVGELTIYDNVNRKGDVVWKDLCRGPHLPSTKIIGNAFKIMRNAAAYWRGSEKNPQLQRIYGTAWPNKAEMVAYLDRLAEAEKRDHRRLGAQLDLYSFPDELGSGLPVFHPRGGVIRRVMEDYVREKHLAAGFEYVSTPHISKEGLFHTSGHLPYYADTMFPPMDVDGADYYLKAMNCPMHNLIYRSQGRSYRQLPVRYFEFGNVYRYEKSGVVHGLTRVRGMTQDDSHTYCTPEQAKSEVAMLLDFVTQTLQDFGLSDYYLELSTRDEDGEKRDKFIGSDADWDAATQVLAEVAQESGIELVPDPGGAAFYGPKISVQIRDAIGRSWQMSTIQYDFNQPERFALEYQDADGERKRPIMLHAAKFGSFERFIGVLVEHYAGAFPAWLSPVQVLGVPVAEEFDDYLAEVLAQLREQGVRVEADFSNDRFPKKIRNASTAKVPFVLIVGEKDRSAGAVSFRFRDGSQRNGVPIAEAIGHVLEVIASHKQN